MPEYVVVVDAWDESKPGHETFCKNNIAIDADKIERMGGMGAIRWFIIEHRRAVAEMRKQAPTHRYRLMTDPIAVPPSSNDADSDETTANGWMATKQGPLLCAAEAVQGSWDRWREAVERLRAGEDAQHVLISVYGSLEAYQANNKACEAAQAVEP